jgi:penicillin-binding protein 2
MVSAVANGGQVWKLRLVDHVEYPDGRLYQEHPPELMEEVHLSPKTRALVCAALRDVVQAPNGTGKRARLHNIEVAGKTGTAQTVSLALQAGSRLKERQDHAWFVCYAPVEQPEIAVVVLVEHGGHGGEAAAPIARQIMEAYFLGQTQPPGSPGVHVSRR